MGEKYGFRFWKAIRLLSDVRVGFAVCLTVCSGLLAATTARGVEPQRQPPAATTSPQLEQLGRGVVAVRQEGGGVFVSWRLLNTDPAGAAFHVYRQTKAGKATKLTSQPISASTNWVDKTADATSAYTYSVQLVNAKGTPIATPAAPSEQAAVWAQNYLRVPLKRPAGGSVNSGTAETSEYTYTANDASVADLDGDGQYEIVLKWEPSNSRDNGSSGITGPVLLDAYKLDGTQLWRINLGRNIRAGAHYTQFLVYDFDGDGKAEVACKTADGSVDGRGTVIGDAGKDYRSLTVPTDARAVQSIRDKTYGRVLAGPEYFTVFNGLTGAAMASAPYVSSRDPLDGWGGIGGNGGNDNHGNRADRMLAAVAYLDGVHPSAVMCRGYYGRSVLAAWDWRNGKLTQRWVFDSQNDKNPFSGMGNHGLSVNDVDFDGKDEIVYGSMVVDDNGTGLFSTGLRHGDALHVSNLDPSTPDLEAWGVHENEEEVPGHENGPGAALYNARTGKVLLTKLPGTDVGRGMAADIDPRYPGAELWASNGELGLLSCQGERIGPAPRAVNFGIWWDGDLLRELLDGTTISKWDYQAGTSWPLLDGKLLGAASCNGTKATPCLSADLFGDWREEVVWRNANNEELMIFTTTIPTKHRFVTLMQDPAYRVAVARENVGYNQPPHPSFYLGEGMKTESVKVGK
ncbi:rhamnogalacturonan lyase [Hymenobacter norwichensis]|uniref:rhamnogalacturonan lyase n=1 Tax=Hymenobacter norwichensis TaxID=223903 RepID=UPI0008FFB8A5|nr:rhamnogalacturonan lyase [Hymenobacter norwichensis]